MAPKRRAERCDVEVQQRGRAAATTRRSGSPARSDASDAPQDRRQRQHADRDGRRAERRRGVPQRLSLGRNSPGSLGELRDRRDRALADDDDHGDAGREADGHRIGDVFDEGADAAEIRSRSGSRPRSASPAPARHSLRAATISATSTMKAPAGPPIWKRLPPSSEIRKPPTIGGVEPALRADAGGDRDRHRQRQGHDRDGEAGDGVGAQVLEAVALAQDGHELRREELGEGRLRCG